jgi:hypothetical protein
MPDVSTEMLTTREAAEFLRIKPSTLITWRFRGKGPPYRKHGGKVLYSVDDLRSWSEARRVPAS